MAKAILLTHGKSAIVDDADYDWLCKFKWVAHVMRGGYDNFYARRRIDKNKSIFMHREILGLGEFCAQKSVDHINGDGLDNRRSNLRVTDQSGNMRNRRPNKGCQYKGVYARFGKFIASISINGKMYHLGMFHSAEAAAKAYDLAANEFFGEYARLNCPKPSK